MARNSRTRARWSIAVRVFIGSTLAIAVGTGQQPSDRAARPEFEVASIKLCRGNNVAGRSDGTPPPGRLIRECQTVIALIRAAYVTFANGHADFASSTPVDGGPAWIDSDRYTINAKAEGTPGDAMMSGPMLQALLEDRFKLKLHHETKEVPIYELVLAKGGSKLRAFREGSCTPFDFTKYPPDPPSPGQQICIGRNKTNGPNRTVDEPGMKIDDFCKVILGHLDRPVINRTGLVGRFDFHLEYAREGVAPSDEPPGPSIFAAVQEQLGLRLVPAKGPSDSFVIDHVEKPSEN